MDSGAIVNREIRLLSDLARELVKLGFQVGMSDARPAVFIGDDAGRVALVISVSGDYFEWCSGADSHLVTDPVGAVGAIAAEIWRRAEDARETP
jgi:hypothetical protein